MPMAPDERERNQTDAARYRERLAATPLPLPTPHLFLHLPKTAGTSLSNALRLSHGQRRVLQFWLRPPSDAVVPVEGVRAIIGHLPWGFHAWLRDTPGAERYTYATVLREPIARTLSHYHYHRKKQDDPNHWIARELDLLEWVQTVPYASNVMTGWLAGLRHESWWHARAMGQPPDGGGTVTEADTAVHVTEEHYERARARLLEFGFVGLTERFAESLVLMRHVLGMRACTPPRSNVGPSRNPAPNDAEYAAVRDANVWDIRLYALAQDLFRAQVEVFGGDEALRAACARPLRPGERARELAYLFGKAVRSVAARGGRWVGRRQG
jgi:hypothetical protein